MHARFDGGQEVSGSCERALDVAVPRPVAPDPAVLLQPQGCVGAAVGHTGGACQSLLRISADAVEVIPLAWTTT